MGRSAGSIDEKKLMDRYKSMVKYQNEISPFTPTIRELQSLWGLNTTSAVALCLKNLVKKGYVISRLKGNSKNYFAK